jgi:hypothetical protein
MILSAYWRPLYFLSAMVLAAGLPSSNTLMSVGQIVMALAWFAEWNWKEKVTRLRQHFPLVLFSLIYLLFVLGLIHTMDTQEGLQQLRIKLPLFILPVMIGSMPFYSSRQMAWIVHSLLGSLLICSVFGLLIYSGWMNTSVEDYRKLSPFISNIRFSTLLVFAVFTCMYVFRKSNHQWRLIPRSFYIFFSFYFLGYLFLLKSITGLYVLVGVFFFVLIYYLIRKGNKFYLAIASFGFIFFVFTLITMYHYEWLRYHDKEVIDFKTLPLSSRNGNIYKHDTLSWAAENGHYVWINVARYEIEKSWNERSEIDFDGLTHSGVPVKATLVHYLASKGLKKDADAVMSLSEKEIKAIENGTDNYLYLNRYSLRPRFYQLVKEMDYYHRTGDPTAKSFAMRIEIWKHALHQLFLSPWIGYGTGDVMHTMRDAYIHQNTKLHPAFWMNPHQQYFSFALALGIPLGLLCIFLIIQPVFITSFRLHILFYLFLVIVLLAMIDENTLDTQAGVTQVAFLYSLLFLVEEKHKENE